MAKVTGQAPGRLDFLGGVADYSGSLVLEMPLRLTTRVTITETRIPELVFHSEGQESCTIPLGTDPQDAPKWVRYPYGCLGLFSAAQRWKPKGGLKFQISSSVPKSMGVSSSAALEVATLRTLEKLSGQVFTGTKLAKLAQRAENEIVGAPCGLMDQLASAYGVRGALLPILCRPDILGDPVKLPTGVIAVGWPSGVKHAVSDSPYATARAAAFMGKKLIEKGTKQKLTHATELSPSQVRSLSEKILPVSMTGRVFKNRCGGVDDPLSTIEASRRYDVRAAVSFPIEENNRSGIAVSLLRGISKTNRQDSLKALGELLYQSHAGYSSIGLGCPETNQMVEGVRSLGALKGFYGARVSGGGSGGTVVVLLDKTSLPSLTRLARKLKRPTDFIL